MGKLERKLIPTLWLCASLLSAQTTERVVGEFLSSIRAGESPVIPASLPGSAGEREVLASCAAYFSDSLAAVRAGVYRLVAAVASASGDDAFRQASVMALLRQKADLENTSSLITSLQQFRGADFSSEARDSVAAWVRASPPYLNELIRLAGVLKVIQLTPDLEKLSGPSNRNRKTRWSSLLALSRMGDTRATAEILRRVERLSVNDDVVYDIFPDLVYTRQKPLFDYLLDVILREEKNCLAADAGDETPIVCAYRVMEMVAPAIEGFPVGVDASGDLDVRDYEKALLMVRTWIGRNRDKYRIKTEEQE